MSQFSFAVFVSLPTPVLNKSIMSVNLKAVLSEHKIKYRLKQHLIIVLKSRALCKTEALT